MTSKEAIELLKRATMFEPTLENRDYPEAFELAIKALEERPQGKWIEDDNHNIVCPFCGGHRRDSRIDHINFCNRCGAQMRGDKE